METKQSPLVRIYTDRWGWQDCTVGYDEAGNPRVYPVNGASLQEWRDDKSLVPPWLIIGDCDARHYNTAINSLLESTQP